MRLRRRGATWGLYPRGIEDASQQVPHEERFGEAAFRVAHGRVPHPPLAHVPAPRYRVICAHGAAAVGRFVHGGQHVGAAARRASEIVPLVRALPPSRQPHGGGMRGVLDVHRRRHDPGMVLERAAEHLPVPRPFVLARQRPEDRAMDGREPAAAKHIALEGLLLVGIEHVARHAEEHDHPVAVEIVGSDRARILGRINGEAVPAAQLPKSPDAIRDRRVPVAQRPREDQHPERGIGIRRPAGDGREIQSHGRRQQTCNMPE